MTTLASRYTYTAGILAGHAKILLEPPTKPPYLSIRYTSANPEIPHYLHSNYGGSIIQNKRSLSRSTYTYTIKHQYALALLTNIYPFLTPCLFRSHTELFLSNPTPTPAEYRDVADKRLLAEVALPSKPLSYEEDITFDVKDLAQAMLNQLKKGQ